MPRISLVVVLRNEKDLLARLLSHAQDCYDDLVVVHDGIVSAEGSRSLPARPPLEIALDYSELPASAPIPAFYTAALSPPAAGPIHELVVRHAGRYFEGIRCYQQEPHWPFAWWQAQHDWILRLDADEFPSQEMHEWLRAFRAKAEPSPEISGYTCLWPLWNGKRATTKGWPGGRNFLFDKRRVRFFGMVEQVPIPDERWEPLNLVLHHQPAGKSYGLRNIVLRRQAYRWRDVIAQSLIGRPIDLPCWRWKTPEWPAPWEAVRRRPLKHSLSTLVRYPVYQFAGMLKAGLWPNLSAGLNPGLHHFMLGLRVWKEQRRKRRTQS